MHQVVLDGPDPKRHAEPARGLDHSRPEVVRVVRRQVRSGTYRPRSDEIAELLIAWLFLPSGTRAT